VLAGDGTIRVWHTPTLSLVYLLHPPHDNIGDILSLAWLPSDSLEDDEHAGHRRGVGMGHSAHEGGRRGAGRLFAGCQDTSIQVRSLSLILLSSTCGDAPRCSS